MSEISHIFYLHTVYPINVSFDRASGRGCSYNEFTLFFFNSLVVHYILDAGVCGFDIACTSSAVRDETDARVTVYLKAQNRPTWKAKDAFCKRP